MPLDYKLIGSNIRGRRKELKITQQKMADDLFLSTSLITKLERGVKAVSLDTFCQIAEYLDTNIAVLTADPDDPKVQHNQMIQEIDILLEDLDNRHLRIASQLMKTYASQVQELFSRPDTTDPSPDQPPSR
ncbi:MAG: helix-turn-helix transcriptional regulator [Eubacterium sp.]|nr:helix-turn-helix transcriptional regulator [Eubacterium sp.]